MDNDTTYIDALILSYLNLDLDQAGRQELESWALSSEENKHYFRQTCEVWLLSGTPQIRDRYNARKAFEHFRLEHSEAFAEPKSDPPHALRTAPRRFRALAAVLAAVIAAGAFWIGSRLSSRTMQDRFSDIIIEAPWGSSSSVTLPDGTKVTMNAGSRIAYSQGFGISDRDIRLSGEGYFEVAPNKDLPLRVASSDLTVRAVGTRFNFRDYPEDLEAIVTLQDGKVALLNQLQPAEVEKYLNPNQRIILDKHNGEMLVESKDAANAMQWTSGNLFYDEVLLSDIVKDLERYYDVHITLQGDELRSMRVYASFSRREMGISDILDLLSATNKISYRVAGREIFVNSHQ